MPLLTHVEFSKRVDQTILRLPVGALTDDGKLDLFKQGIGPDLVAPLLAALRANDTIKHVLLGNNFIGRAGAEAIANFILTDRTGR